MKNGLYPSPVKPGFALRVEKSVPMNGWVRISQELLDVPHLHLTLTITKEMRPYFDRDRSLLKLLLTTAADAVRQVIAVTYGDIRVGLVYTLRSGFGF
jgi:hypothetical protein